MKTSLFALLTAAFLGLATYASGHTFDAADLTALLFTTGLVAWTLQQYAWQPRPLNLTRPIHLPRQRAPRPADADVAQLAA